MNVASSTAENDRLRALESYEILDTDPETEFDDIVKLAAALCGVPVALITLLDGDRQWFKAAHGVADITGEDTRETPVEMAICTHALHAGDFLEINDAKSDPRTANNPLVTGDTDIGFYAGKVLQTPEGTPLGTLCVLDDKPGALTPLQRDALHVLGDQVMAQLNLRRELRQADLLRREVDHRVKNSLQSLASYTRISARLNTSEDARDALKDVSHRIEAISLLHEQLYKTNAGSRIDLADYLALIVEHLRSVAPHGVVVTLDAEPVQANSSQAASVGTLINEFAANSFKHAFKDRVTGMVQIQMTVQDGQITLVMADDGEGVSGDTGFTTGGLGMLVAEAICEQLDTTLELMSTATGVTAQIVFTPQA